MLQQRPTPSEDPSEGGLERKYSAHPLGVFLNPFMLGDYPRVIFTKIFLKVCRPPFGRARRATLF